MSDTKREELAEIAHKQIVEGRGWYAVVDALLDELMKPREPEVSIMLAEMLRCLSNHNGQIGLTSDSPERALKAYLTHIKEGKP